MNNKILIVGMSPLPNEKARYNHAGGIRSWLFLEKIIKIYKPSDLDIYMIYNNSFYNKPYDENIVNKIKYGGYTINLISEKLAQQYLIFNDLISQNNYSSILSISSYPSYIISLADTSDVPWWADINGDTIIEGQSKTYTENDNQYVIYFHNMLSNILKKADYFSTCSNRQKYVLIGELCMLGRINKNNEGIDLVYDIPEPYNIISTKKIIRQESNKDKFIITWIGGYNTWTDPVCLFKALINTFEKNDNIEYHSTGGEITIHTTKSFRIFKGLIQKSKFIKKFHFYGYVSNLELEKLIYKSNLGINIDRFNYEGLIGARNRINTFISHKTPVLSSILSEISKELNDKKLILGYETGNYHNLANKFLWAEKNRNKLKIMAEKAYLYAQQQNSHTNINQTLSWLKYPHKSNLSIFQKNTQEPIQDYICKPQRRDKLFLYNTLKFGYKRAIYGLINNKP